MRGCLFLSIRRRFLFLVDFTKTPKFSPPWGLTEVFSYNFPVSLLLDSFLHSALQRPAFIVHHVLSLFFRPLRRIFSGDSFSRVLSARVDRAGGNFSSYLPSFIHSTPPLPCKTFLLPFCLSQFSRLLLRSVSPASSVHRTRVPSTFLRCKVRSRF